MSSTESIATPALPTSPATRGMVGVVAAVGREVEGDGDPLSAAGEGPLVEGVRFLGGGEAGVLADRPGPDRVHRRLRPAHEGLKAGQRVGVGKPLDVARRVEGFDDDSLGRDPIEGGDIALGRFRGGFLPRGEVGGTRQFLGHLEPSKTGRVVWCAIVPVVRKNHRLAWPTAATAGSSPRAACRHRHDAPTSSASVSSSISGSVCSV